MISRLRGQVVELNGRLVTLDVQGVGYEVMASGALLKLLALGQEAEFVVYTDVKEDSIKLYGFEDQLEKQVFLLLTKVRGLGAKSAAEVISGMDKRELLRAIGAGDLRRLQSVRRVGKKLAERIVVELKDRVAEFALERSLAQSIEIEITEPFREAVQALEALGFSRPDAERAVQKVQLGAKPPSDTALILKEALRFV
jgi:Holliday junction DNA helicase RuvA